MLGGKGAGAKGMKQRGIKGVYSFAATFVLSLILCGFLIRTARSKGIYDDTEGVQKFHRGKVPRLGGLAIFASLFATSIAFVITRKPLGREVLFVLVAGIPVFAAGLLEDITRKVGPKWRLLASFASGLFACLLLPVELTGVELPFLDPLFKNPIFSTAFTVFAIAGTSQAFNIIDGFNGLCSGVAIMVFSAYALVAYITHQSLVLLLSMCSLSATLGFFLWNYPWGSIFLGDGGAYLLGYLVAVEGFLLVKSHRVSPWFLMLLVAYPVWETVFSMFRRKVLHRKAPYIADALHLHSLIYKRVVRHTFPNEKNPVKKNSFTSPYLWSAQMMLTLAAVAFRKNTPVLLCILLGFVILYVWLYIRIISFKTPNFLKSAWVANHTNKGHKMR